MKKTFTILAAVAVALSASAAPVKHQDKATLIQKSQTPLTMEVNGKTLTVVNTPSTSKKAPKKADVMTDIITNVSGKTKNYTKACAGFFNYQGYLIDYEEEAMAAKIVFGDDNDVYFYDIISTLSAGSYVKGTLEGNKITVSLPQSLEWVDEYDCAINLRVIDIDIDWDEGTVDSSVDFDTDSVTFTVGDDGVITMDDLGENKYLGVMWSDDDSWYGNADLYQVYTPFEGVVNSVPVSVVLQPYSYIVGDFAYGVEVGFDGDTLYIKGLAYAMPDGVIVASCVGGKAVVAQDQILGSSGGSFVVAKCAFENPDYNIDDEPYVFAPADAVFELKVDMESKTITCVNPEMVLVYNYYGYDTIDGVAALQDFTLSYQDSYAGVPRNPLNLSFTDEWLDYYGYYSFMFDVPNVSVEGTMIKPENLYYRIYMDGELFEFEYDEENWGYDGIPEGEVWTEIGFDFTNYNDFFTWDLIEREVGFYVEGMETLGVQSINYCDGKTYCSDIVTLDIETGEVTVETGVDTIASDSEATYFDLSGRRVANPAKGIYIVRSADKTRKVIVK